MRPVNAKPDRSERVTLAALLVAVAVVGVLAMPGERYVGDPYAATAEARALLLRRSLAVEPELESAFGGERGEYLVANPRDGKLYSKHGILNGLAYVPALAVEWLVTGALPLLDSPARLVGLNVTNLLLSLWLGLLLYRVARLYTSRPVAAALFVGSCFWATFLWNYLRAQSGDVLQVVGFTGFYLHFVRYLRESRSRDAAGFWLYLSALCLTKISYVLLLPVALGVLAWKLRRPRLLVLFGWPAIALVGVIGLICLLKFGSPLLTGYHQWRPAAHLPFHAAEGLWGFAFDVQRSVFVAFPLLALATAGLLRMYRDHRFELGLIAGIVALFWLAIGTMETWKGEWCYGPRYLLFVLPVASVPFVFLVERCLELTRAAAVRAVPVLVVLAFSVLAQLEVNGLSFFAFYRLRSPLGPLHNPVADAYFASTHFAHVNRDHRRARSELASLPFYREALQGLPSEAVERYRQFVLSVTDRPNYFWQWR
ncbi:MAG: hypothetical protein QM765_23050 [Myxococcales bacterium]